MQQITRKLNPDESASLTLTNPKPEKEDTDAMVRLKKGLHNVFADAYLLGLRNQAIHWHAKGLLFYAIHKISEDNYELLSEYVDKLAEKMRAMNLGVPTSLFEFTNLTQIPVTVQFDTLTTEQMVEQVLSDLSAAKGMVEAAISNADEAKDPIVADLLTELAGVYDHEHWMLKSLLA